MTVGGGTSRRLPPKDGASQKTEIVSQALTEGFAAARICTPNSVPEIAERLEQFVAEGRHGDMAWMGDRMNWRGNPAALWPEAKSVIMLAEPYTPSHDPMTVIGQKDRAAISVYAQNRDYHDIVKKRLKRVGRWMIDHFGGEIKVFVDTAPVMEKPLGAAAGLGWQGKHTNLLSRELGNWFFLGAIFTTLELPVDAPGQENCGSCTSCLDACPTDAFPAPFQLDGRRCISYLTIEHKGPVDEELRAKLGNRIYGCDDCLAACPWNKFAVEASEIRYAARDDLVAPKLSELLTLDDTAFREKFSGSPVKRIGRNRFLRNVLYAVGNSGDAAFLPMLEPHLIDPDPVVADAAGWAKQRLIG
ncbi:tRNA epoxyqueuosine(34) reductase QueG [Aliiroseovarius sp. F20344]|uniref:tRNA epoxyqueuosine(34) reductase QueG n=1 Tax=Aliiroseovarius sp. F20344 TaxID=2926414 RepID=UPI001FF5518B|nr:tRNA epoxyqueuosine(34) reductase QueG [Aliiroseovarius sp. F20344]MCK0141447.1 tRNA epoxyqueuosine(34) reductase QueG [Aliiroseovarius sp. F20344]